MSKASVTGLFEEMCAGSAEAKDQLFTLLYDELRALARSYMARQRADHTLSPTALVNEAVLKLLGSDQAKLGRNRGEFFAVASRAIRSVLVDHARRRSALRRPTSGQRISIDLAGLAEFERVEKLDLLALDESLERLGQQSQRQYEIVMLHFFGGLGFREIADYLSVSTSTVEKDWHFCRAWLCRAMNKGRHHAS